MSGKNQEFGIGELITWLYVGAVSAIVVSTILAIIYEVAGSSSVTILSAFGAGLSAVVSALLVGIYIEQTNIFRRHGEILENQSELMELQFIPDVSPICDPDMNNNTVEITLENKGPGAATDIQLITRIEFQNSKDYQSPLTGSSELNKIKESEFGEQTLPPGQTGEYQAEALLEIESSQSEKRARSFGNIIDNLQEEIDEDIRISLFVKAKGKGGQPQTVEILPEEAFYTSLDDLKENTLRECRRVSIPA